MTVTNPGRRATSTDITRLRSALVRKFAITSATPSRVVTEYPDLAADLAVGIAGRFIDEARADERRRCVGLLREWQRDLVTEADSGADLLRAAVIGQAADLLDLPQAAVPGR